VSSAFKKLQIGSLILRERRREREKEGRRNGRKERRKE
jgi:hypothetical protein